MPLPNLFSPGESGPPVSSVSLSGKINPSVVLISFLLPSPPPSPSSPPRPPRRWPRGHPPPRAPRAGMALTAPSTWVSCMSGLGARLFSRMPRIDSAGIHLRRAPRSKCSLLHSSFSPRAHRILLLHARPGPDFDRNLSRLTSHFLSLLALIPRSFSCFPLPQAPSPMRPRT